MSVFADTKAHDLNPPETWKVVKVAERAWRVTTADGTVLEYATSRREALEKVESGSVRRIYDKETRWYAGESIPGWKDRT